MENTPNTPKDPELLARLKEEGEVGIKVKLEAFRADLKKLAESAADPRLQGMDFSKLTEEDMAIFDKFKKAELSMDEIDKQLEIFAPSIAGEYINSVRFLQYIRSQLSTSTFDRR